MRVSTTFHADACTALPLAIVRPRIKPTRNPGEKCRNRDRMTPITVRMSPSGRTLIATSTSHRRCAMTTRDRVGDVADEEQGDGAGEEQAEGCEGEAEGSDPRTRTGAP